MLEQWNLMVLKLLLNIRTFKNIKKKRKVIIVFDNMIADMLNNKKLYPIVFDCMFLSCHVRVSE